MHNESDEEMTAMTNKCKVFTFQLLERKHTKEDKSSWPFSEKCWSVVHSDEVPVADDSEDGLIGQMWTFASDYLRIPVDTPAMKLPIRFSSSPIPTRKSFWVFFGVEKSTYLCHAELVIAQPAELASPDKEIN